MSNTVTSAFLPAEIDVNGFINGMENEGYMLYPRKGPLLKRNLFQVANMGQIFPEDCKEFIRVLERVLRKGIKWTETHRLDTYPIK